MFRRCGETACSRRMKSHACTLASACSSVAATVLLPEPLRPVNHSTQPCWPSRASFSTLHIRATRRSRYPTLPSQRPHRSALAFQWAIM